MKIKYYAHACFGVEGSDGLRVIIDPYEPGSFDGAIQYAAVEDEAAVVLVSHDHADHNYTKSVKGTPEILKGAGQAAGIDFKAIEVFHDEAQGSDRGEVVIFSWEQDGIKICHLGDLGHTLSEEQLGQIAGSDVLLIPVGGLYTIDAEVAGGIVKMLKPKLVIPMHFKTPKCGFPIASVEDFLKGKANVKKVGSSELEISKDNLPSEQEIVVLEPSA